MMDELFRGLLRRAIRAGTNASFGYLAATLEARADKVYESYIQNREGSLRNREEKEASEKSPLSELTKLKSELTKFMSDLNQTDYQMLSILDNALKSRDLNELRYAKKLSMCPMCMDVIKEAERKIEEEGDKGWDYLRDHINVIRVAIEARRIINKRGIVNPTDEQWKEIEQEAKSNLFK